MESLFENEYELTKKEYGEFELHRLTHSRSLAFFVFYCIFIAAFFIYFRVRFGVSQYLYFLFIPAYLLLILIGAMLRVRRSEKAQREQCGGKPCVIRHIFYDDHAETVNTVTGGTGRIEYANIKRLSKTKSLLMLETRAKLAYPMRKDSFTKGSAEEFRRFIEAKIASNESKA